MKAMVFLRRMLVIALDRLGVYSSVLLRRQGPLLEDGWFRSFREKKPVNSVGEPIPWLTYPALDFLEPRISPSLSVFEYGCGHSTLWWAARVRQLVAVEHDSSWIAAIRSRLPDTAVVRHHALEPAAHYVNAIVAEATFFDIVVIDGRHRNQCLHCAPQALSPRGVIILDNSDRPQYQPGSAYLQSLGFRHVDFSGLVPVVCWKSCTSIYYRDDNVLGL
ncbi:MAG: FkbM family methyltransferase [Candidatus Accumulibacter delftensis]|jgi:hypothetical protein